MRVMKRLMYTDRTLKGFFVLLFLPFLCVVANASPSPNPGSKAFQKCKEINVSYVVVKDRNTDDKSSIKIDVKETQISELIISLVGPKKLFLRDITEMEIKNLSKGTYSLVIVGREESAGYCPRHFQVVIK
jgi:hypothetical protein